VTIPPESVEVGKCYLAWTSSGRGQRFQRVRQVVELLPDGRVKFATRRRLIEPEAPWPRTHVMTITAFAGSAEREVPCDWTGEADEAKP
jgi:hypothetical protein